MAGHLVRENYELRERVRMLEQSVALHRRFLQQIDELVVADTRPDRYVVPALHFDAVMRAAGFRPDPPNAG
jgi:hypothetical protein